MKKKTVVFLFILNLSFTCFCQELVRQTTGVSGASNIVNINSESYIVQQTVGQGSVIGTYQSGGLILRQGFIQPLEGSFKISVLENKSLDVSIFPNPFSNLLNLTFSDSIEDPVNVTVYDILGRVVFNKQYLPTDSNSLTLDLDFLNKSQYILNLSMNDKNFTSKIIKN